MVLCKARCYSESYSEGVLRIPLCRYNGIWEGSENRKITEIRVIGGINVIKVNREEINMLRLADDIAIVGCEADLQNSLKIIEKLFQEYNMKINSSAGVAREGLKYAL
jgi:hypothetical protein